jgi:hypothetical protein
LQLKACFLPNPFDAFHKQRVVKLSRREASLAIEPEISLLRLQPEFTLSTAEGLRMTKGFSRFATNSIAVQVTRWLSIPACVMVVVPLKAFRSFEIGSSTQRRKDLRIDDLCAFASLC